MLLWAGQQLLCSNLTKEADNYLKEKLHSSRYVSSGIGHIQGYALRIWGEVFELIRLTHIELHGDEDGFVPATFQIIFVVSNSLS